MQPYNRNPQHRVATPQQARGVTSRPLGETPQRRATTGADVMVFIGRIGVFLSVLVFGGVVWAINGGFSVLGLQTVAESFNTSGAVFWQVMSSITVTIPLPETATELQAFAHQPALPWLGVLAATCVQTAAMFLGLAKRPIPFWLLIAVVLLSAYDLGTTFFGLRTVQWALDAGVIVQVVLTLFITFIVEIAVGLLFRLLRR